MRKCWRICSMPSISLLLWRNFVRGLKILWSPSQEGLCQMDRWDWLKNCKLQFCQTKMILLLSLQTSECQEFVPLSLKWILFPSIYIWNYFFWKKFLMANFTLIDNITHNYIFSQKILAKWLEQAARNLELTDKVNHTAETWHILYF